MTRLPRLTGKQLLKALQRAGFRIARTRGSHHFVQHADGRMTTVPVHAGEMIGPGLLRSILRDLDMSAEQLDELL